MNIPILTQNNLNQSMDSDEISLLVESRPDNVKRTIERLAIKGVITLPPMEEKPTAGRPATVYVFSGEKGKRDSIIVVAQLCPEFTARLVDRWQELERNAVQPVMDLNNPEFLRQALLGYTERVIELEQQVQILEPKAKVLDAIAETANTYTIRESVKAIGGILEKDLIQLLIDRRWIYRDESKRLQPYSDKVQKGIFVNKTSPVIKNQNDGQERVFLQMRVTAFGLTRIAGLVQKMKQVAA